MMNSEHMVIAGYAETHITHSSGLSAYQHGGDVLDQLMQSTGLPKEAVDGLSVSASLSEGANPFFAGYVAEALGLSCKWLNLSALGGASALAGVAAAASAIQAGRARMVLVLSADAPSSKWGAEYGAFRAEFQAPIGITSPPASFGLLMSRYAYEFGDPTDALASIAVTQRRHALLNNNACIKLKKPLDKAGYLASKFVAEPLRILDSVMFCDGANAVLVTTEETAKQYGLDKRINITGYAEMSNPGANQPLRGITESGFSELAPRLFAQSGLQPGRIDQLQAYDDFTIAVLLQLEHFGFCKNGEGRDFVLSHDLSYDGDLPLNTGGGQLSAGQPGLASGGLNLVEAVRQLFQEGGARQIKSANNALVTGIGMIPYGRSWITSAAMTLEV